MSFQTGILHLNGWEATWQEVCFLLEGVKDRNPDYSEVRETGPVALGFRGFLIAPEDGRDQPLRNERGDLLTFDGRLDSRKDFARRLGLPATTPKSDAELVLIGYERFEQGLFELLSGEFALVLWDQERGSLFMVRSLCGTRPLYYCHSKDKVMWSSALDDLVIKSGVEPAVNEAYVFGFMCYQPDIGESPFRNVSVIPPGTYIEIMRSGETLGPRVTWHPDRISTLRLQTDADYEEFWRQQVEASVVDKLRASRPVWCELSGGFDSSTIIMMCDRISAAAGTEKVTTTSCTFETSDDCDEGYFISIVEDARGSKGIRIPESAQRATLGLDDIKFTGVPNANHLYPGRFEMVQQLMGGVGSRVLLRGVGGDELFWSDFAGSPELADLISQGHFFSALSMGRQWSKIAGHSLWQTLFTYALAPLTAGWKWFPWRPSNGTIKPWTPARVKEWLAQPGRSHALQLDSLIDLPSRRMLVHSMRSAVAVLAAGYYNEFHQMYCSFPYLHQGLIESMLSLPINQLVRPGETRSLMRRATRGLLPDAIRTRLSKGRWDVPFLRALAQHSDRIGTVGDFEICQRGFAEPSALSESIYMASLGQSDHVGGLVRVFAVERWLRSLSTISARRSMLAETEPTLRGIA